MKPIHGKNIILRTVKISDAEFILEMRTQQNKAKYLSKIDNDIAKQKIFLQGYKQREVAGQEYYFLISNQEGDGLGLVRVYDLQKDSFCWGGAGLLKLVLPKQWQ